MTAPETGPTIAGVMDEDVLEELCEAWGQAEWDFERKFKGGPFRKYVHDALTRAGLTVVRTPKADDDVSDGLQQAIFDVIGRHLTQMRLLHSELIRVGFSVVRTGSDGGLEARVVDALRQSRNWIGELSQDIVDPPTRDDMLAIIDSALEGQLIPPDHWQAKAAGLAEALRPLLAAKDLFDRTYEKPYDAYRLLVQGLKVEREWQDAHAALAAYDAPPARTPEESA